MSFFSLRGGNNAMAVLYQFSFAIDTKFRFIHPYTNRILYRSKGMQHGDMWDIPTSLQPFADPTRKPVVAVYQIVMNPIPVPEIVNLMPEFRKMRINVQFIYLFLLPRLKMYKPGIFPQFHYLIMYRLVSAGIDINHVSSLSQFTAEFPDIDTHSTGVFPSQFT
jgi:hypothetical protein